MKSLGEQLHDIHVQKIRSCLKVEKQGYNREGLENYTGKHSQLWTSNQA